MRRKAEDVLPAVEQADGAQQRFAGVRVGPERVERRREPRRADDAVHRVAGKAAGGELGAQLGGAVEVRAADAAVRRLRCRRADVLAVRQLALNHAHEGVFGNQPVVPAENARGPEQRGVRCDGGGEQQAAGLQQPQAFPHRGDALRLFGDVVQRPHQEHGVGAFGRPGNVPRVAHLRRAERNAGVFGGELGRKADVRLREVEQVDLVAE